MRDRMSALARLHPCSAYRPIQCRGACTNSGERLLGLRFGHPRSFIACSGVVFPAGISRSYSGTRKGDDGHAVSHTISRSTVPEGGFYVDVYDPTCSSRPGERTPADHLDRQGYNDASVDHGSRIHVIADEHGILPSTTEEDSGQHFHDDSVLTLGILRPQTSRSADLPTSIPGLEELVLGGSAQTVQVSDAAGDTLLNPDGT